MPWQSVNVEQLKKLFSDGFFVMDIAEPLRFVAADRFCWRR